MDPTPSSQPSKALRPLQSPIPDVELLQSGMPQFYTSIKEYHTIGATLPGRRNPGFQFTWRQTIAAYTWNPQDSLWRTDSVLLGLSKRGLAILDHAAVTTTPHDAPILERILRETVLDGCEGPPTELLHMLQQYPGLQGRKFHSVSAPLPIYHASGMSKDVYLFLMIALPETPHRPCKELSIALKIAKRGSSISEQELAYHLQVCKTPEGRRCLSQLLGWYDLNRHPSLKMPDRVVSLEVFHSGDIAGRYLKSSAQVAMACTVAKATFTLVDAAIAAGQGSHSKIPTAGNRLSVRLPSDLNPGNFVMQTPHRAVMVDCGRYQPPHTFTQLMLRLIRTYWTTETAERPKGFVIPLEKLFGCVKHHFGEEEGTKLLKEFAVSLGIMRGTPIATLRQRYPGTPVNAIGDTLVKTYGYDEEAGSSARFVSTAIATQSNRYKWRLAELVNDHAIVEPFMYAKASTIVFHFTDKELRNIARQLTAYLTPKKSDLHLNSAHAPEIARKQRDISHTQGWNSLTGLIREALYFAPFPDPSVVSLGIQTVNLFAPGQFTSMRDHDWRLYKQRLLHISAMLWSMFEDRDFTLALSRIAGATIYEAFMQQAKSISGNSAESRIEVLLQQWIGIFATIHWLYGEGYMANLVYIQTHRERLKPYFTDIFTAEPRDLPKFFARAFPEIWSGDPRSLELTPEVIALIENRAKAMLKVLRSTIPLPEVPAMPRFARLVPERYETKLDANLPTQPDRT